MALTRSELTVKHATRTKGESFLFRIFQKAEFRAYLVCFHTFTYKIQISTISHKAWASCDYTFHVKVFKFYYESPSFFPVPLLLSIFFVNWNLEILPVLDPDLELRGREGRGAVIQTFRKGERASLQKKNVFRPFGLVDPPLNTFQIFRLISDTYFLSFFVSDIPYQFIRYKIFSQVSICLFYVCSCFVSINPSAAVSLSKFRKINLDAKKRTVKKLHANFLYYFPLNGFKIATF